MMSKWTENTSVTFVSEYGKHECLWNFKHIEHRNKNAQSASSQGLKRSKTLPTFNEKESLSKIRSLRSSLSHEQRNTDASSHSGVGSDDIYIPSLGWFPILDDKLKSMRLNTRETEDNVELYSDDDNGDDKSESTRYQDEDLLIPTQQNASSTVDHLSNMRLNEIHKFANKVESISKHASAKDTKNHEFDLFGNSVAAQLKAMPFPIALQAQQHMQNYLSQIRIEQLHTNHPSSNYVATHKITYIPSPSLIKSIR